LRVDFFYLAMKSIRKKCKAFKKGWKDAKVWRFSWPYAKVFEPFLRCLSKECDRGRGIFWYGLAIYRDYNLNRENTVYNSTHSRHEVFWSDNNPTAYGSSIRPSCPCLGCLLIYTVSSPDIWSHLNFLKQRREKCRH
jgi:hypothetical protein